jgi:adenylate cyclase
VDGRLSPEELARLNLYDPNAPDAAVHLRLLNGAFDVGATLEEVIRAARVRYNIGPLMLDLAMRPPGETMDLADFAASEPDPVMVRRIWSAFGLPDAEAPVVRVTPDAAEAIRVVHFLVVLFGENVALGIARVMGAAMARMSEALAGAFRVSAELPSLNTGQSRADVAESYIDIARDALPTFMDAMAAVFRRHLVNLSFQDWSTDIEQVAVTHERTVCFADLVGSTEALHQMSIREMGDMLRRFEEHVWELVSEGGGRVVKLIGDEAMFVLEDPRRAVQVGLDLIALSPQPVRIGMAHGTVVGLMGDYYGETVNLAARLVGLAEPSTLAVSATVAVAARAGEGALSGGLCTPMGEQVLKGFADPVAVYRVAPLPLSAERPQ